jgi:hypothetical protein
LQQDIPTRLGGLAADLARVASASKIPAIAAVSDLLEESRAFIEWSTPSLLPQRLDDAARLVEIGRRITYWFHTWNHIHNNPDTRQELSGEAQAWSDEILKMSGLLEQE